MVRSPAFSTDGNSLNERPEISGARKFLTDSTRPDALIEASAGTGKTYTIENLVVEILLKTDATIDKILVVTFTEKATSELRARIARLSSL